MPVVDTEQSTEAVEVSDLEWVSRALDPTGQVSFATVAKQGSVCFLANPGVGDCRLLVPLRPRRAAAESVRRYHDAASLSQRLRMAVTEAGLVLGLGKLLTSRHVWMTPPMGDTDEDFIGFASACLGTRIHGFAVTLGPRRYNRKPVVQLFGCRGRTIGFAKLGADPLTNAMVSNEADWLLRARAGSVAVPRVLWSGNWGESEALIVEPVWGRRRPSSRRSSCAGLASSIHNLADPVEGGVFDSAPAKALALLDHRAAMDALEAAEAFEGARLRLGAWHGDLTPWNLLTAGGVTTVIDWEMAATGMPQGSDLLHRHLAVQVELRETPPNAAIGSLRAAAGRLEGTTDRSRREATVAVLLLEYVRRDLELEGLGVAATGLGDLAIEELRRG